MIQLNEIQRQALQQGNPIRLSVPDVGKDCVVMLADTFDDMRKDPQVGGPSMREVAALIAQHA